MRNILVLTDFSNTAYNALFHAAKLMQGIECKYLILNVYNGYTPIQKRIGGKEEAALREQESLEGLKNACHRIRLDDTSTKHSFENLSIRGNLLAEISQIIAHKKIDLIIMGNKGRSEIEAIFMGSNALDVIIKIKQCPTLVIPKELEFKPLHQIGFVTDYKRTLDPRLLRTLIFFAQTHQSQINIIHINEEERLDSYQAANRKLLIKYLSANTLVFHRIPLLKSKTTAINSFLDKLQLDMLVMLNNEHSFLERLTREPVLKRVGFNATVPFLVIPYNGLNKQ